MFISDFDKLETCCNLDGNKIYIFFYKCSFALFGD